MLQHSHSNSHTDRPRNLLDCLEGELGMGRMLVSLGRSTQKMNAYLPGVEWTVRTA